MLLTTDRGYPPHAMRQENVLTIPGVRHSLFKRVYDDVVVAVEIDTYKDRIG
jgi:hypothetical protein